MLRFMVQAPIPATARQRRELLFNTGINRISVPGLSARSVEMRMNWVNSLGTGDQNNRKGTVPCKIATDGVQNTFVLLHETDQGPR